MFQDQFLIEDLFYIPVSNHNPVPYRPYSFNISNNAIETITTRFMDNKAGKITPNIVNGVACDVLMPSSVGFDGGLNHDWVSTRRFIFMLKVRSLNMLGGETITYLQGYTDHDGVTPNGTANPHMVHHINNVIETNRFSYQTPLGIVFKEKLTAIYNVMSGQMGGYGHNLYTIRPVDVVTNVDTLNLINHGSGEEPLINSFTNMQNTLSPFGASSISSTVENGISTEYLSRVINSGVQSAFNRELTVNSFDMSDGGGVRSSIQEPSLSDSRIVRYLSRLAGFKDTQTNFIFNTLMVMDNTIHDRFKVFDINKDIVNPIISNTPEVGDYWHGADMVTLKAYSVIENSVALAVKYGFSRVYFIASNMSNPSGAIDVFITDFRSFINLDDQDMMILLEIFKEKFVSDIFINETMCGKVPTHIEMYVDLLGTSKINISYAGYPSNWYTVPTFASSLFAPILTASQETLDGAAIMLGNTVDAITMELQQAKHGQQQFGYY